MSFNNTNIILNMFQNQNFQCFEVDHNNYQLKLCQNKSDGTAIFSELKAISTKLFELDVDFLVDEDGSIIIQ